MSTALVTGASSGVGRAIAEALAAAGWQVLAIGRNPDRLAELASQTNITAHALDITDRDGLARLVAGRRIDLLINNAGMVPPVGLFQDADQADLDATVAVNLTAQIALTRLVVPGMIDRRQGHVFFTGSITGHAPVANLAVYSATKAALGAFAQALRLELAAHDVRVTEIVAGRIETGLYRDILPEAARAAMYAGQTAVQPQDVAQMVLAIHDLPRHVDVARFDILPTRLPPPVKPAE